MVCFDNGCNRGTDRLDIRGPSLSIGKELEGPFAGFSHIFSHVPAIVSGCGHGNSSSHILAIVRGCSFRGSVSMLWV